MTLGRRQAGPPERGLCAGPQLWGGRPCGQHRQAGGGPQGAQQAGQGPAPGSCRQPGQGPGCRGSAAGAPLAGCSRPRTPAADHGPAAGTCVARLDTCHTHARTHARTHAHARKPPRSLTLSCPPAFSRFVTPVIWGLCTRHKGPPCSQGGHAWRHCPDADAAFLGTTAAAVGEAGREALVLLTASAVTPQGTPAAAGSFLLTGPAGAPLADPDLSCSGRAHTRQDDLRGLPC